MPTLTERFFNAQNMRSTGIMNYLTVLAWSLVGSVASLIGGVLLLRSSGRRAFFVHLALPFGAGALLAAAFFNLLPEAIEQTDTHRALMYALAGFLLFFVLERLLGWWHHHEEHHHSAVDGARNTTHRTLVIIGDTIHNALDGVVLGTAFVVSPTAGIATALAIAAHEVPQEIGDFGILLGKGMRPRRVLLVNIVSALATVVTALLAYGLGSSTTLHTAPLLAVAAGFFVYVAASDIIPDIHEKPRRDGNVQALMLLAGVGVVWLVTTLVPHV